MGLAPEMIVNGTGVITVLSISPLEEDHLSLQAIVGHSRWIFLKAERLLPALALLRQHEISVILCERDLMPGSWIDLLEKLNDASHPPSLIVTSRLADDRLWAEARNVLAKPFDRSEVLRSVKAAWQHWFDQVPKPVAAMRAAS